MANGTLGKSMTIAGAQVTPYAAPASLEFATVSLFLCNLGAVDAKVRIAITIQAATPDPQDHIEYDAVVPANGGILERTCIPLSPNDKVMVFSDMATVAVRVAGLEQTLV